MKEISNWGALFFSSFQTLGQKLMGSIPYLIGALLILGIGWLLAKTIATGVVKLLKLSKFDNLADKANAAEFLEKANITASPSQLIGKFVYWILMLLVVTTAADSLGWTIVSTEISKLMSYLPKLFTAIVIFIIGTTIASLIKDVIKGATSSMGISTGKLISEFVFYLLFVVITLTALNQAGIDTTIITSNLLLILGALLLSAAISYGFASRAILSNILVTYFNKNTFKVGQSIEIGNIKGTITSIGKVAIMVKSGTDTIVVPSHRLIDEHTIIKG